MSNYIAHRWMAQDEDLVCISCGRTEDEAIPDDGPMVSCTGDWSWWDIGREIAPNPARSPFGEDDPERDLIADPLSAVERITCVSAVSGHHSVDIIHVFHGSAVPTVLCGYHAMREGFTS